MTTPTTHERAAFSGASSLPTPEQVAQQPWKYPQGRITPVEDDDWQACFLTWPERLLVVGIWAASLALSITLLHMVFA